MRESLIFEWPGRHHLHLLLPLTILLAAILHAGMFFVFSIIYPRPENSGPEPAQIYFITPGTPDAARLEELLRSSDPAVFAPGRGLDLPDPVPPAAYTPQYHSDKPELAPLPAIAETRMSAPVAAGPVPMRRTAPPAVASSTPAPTALLATQALAERLPSLPTGLVFPIPQGFDPEPAVFLVAVRPDGRVSHIFLQRSSGNTALDLQASALLRKSKFSPAASGEDWDFVSFQWGTDLQPLVPQ